MEKRYILKDGLRLETDVTVKGQSVPISFSGARMRDNKILERGSYTTSDKDIQEALEKSRSFNSLWEWCRDTKHRMSQVKEEPVKEEPVQEGVNISTGEVITVTYVDPKVLEVTNYTLAKNYLKEVFPNVTREEILSADKLKAYAKEKGITFPNWT